MTNIHRRQFNKADIPPPKGLLANNILSKTKTKDGKKVRRLMARYAQDDQLSFVLDQQTHILAEVEEIEYPDLQYSRLIPVSNEAWEWAPSVTYFSEDRYGAAEFSTAKSDDMPLAGITRDKHEVSVQLAKLGYAFDLQEIEWAMRIGIPLESRKARAARMQAELKVEEVGLIGDDAIGTKGLFNQASTVVTATVNGNAERWSALNGGQILKQINAEIAAVANDTKGVLMADTIVLPIDAYALLIDSFIPNTSMTVMEKVRQANMYTATTGQPLTILMNPRLDTAATGGRMVCYRRDPSVLLYHIPMPHKFLDVLRIGHMRYEVGGIMRLAGVDMKRPKAIRYRDNLVA